MSKKGGTPPSASKSVAPRPPEPAADLKLEIERHIGPLVSGPQREQVVLRMQQLVSEQFSGPIAHPRHLRAYEDILEGSAERIVRMAEKAQDHNIAMETKVVSASVWEAKVGMIAGMLVLLLLIGLATYCGMNGNNGLAALLLGSGLLGGAVTLIRGWKNGSNGS